MRLACIFGAASANVRADAWLSHRKTVAIRRRALCEPGRFYLLTGVHVRLAEALDAGTCATGRLRWSYSAVVLR